MSSSCELDCKRINASVGGLLWVRRRNGSWWPGRIMGLDELPETPSILSRMGTPVKLLGSDNASVDWYNLEKSKRVKAFRCGEFDQCIEKAKASASHLNRVALKYARRDDAILHALELESSASSGAHYGFCSRMDTSTRKGNTEYDLMKQKLDNLEGNSVTHLPQSTISFEQLSQIDRSKDKHFMHNKRQKPPNDSEDDGAEGTKRMRGLEDLGLRVVPVLLSTESRKLVLPDTGSLSMSNIYNSLSGGTPIHSSKGSSLSLQRSHTQAGHHIQENNKRKIRCRPLTKVLKSTDKAIDHAFCDEGIMDVKISGLESMELEKTKLSVVANNDSDSTRTSWEKDNTSLSVSEHTGDAVIDAPQSQDSSKVKDDMFLNVLDIPEDDYSNGFCKVQFSRGEKQFEAHNSATQRKERYSSKWQLTRKKSSRYVSKDTGFAERPIQSHAYLMGDNDSFDRSPVSDNCGARGDGFHLRRHQSSNTQAHSRSQESLFTKELPLCPILPPRLLNHQQSHLSSYSLPVPSSLYDVHLDVQTTYKGQHVPLVSLTSKLNGKAIIGHPVTVEVFENGESEHLVRCVDFCPSSGELYNFVREKTSELSTDIMVGTMKPAYPAQSFIEARAKPLNRLTVHSKSNKLRKYGFFSKKMRKLSSIAVGHGYRDERKPVAKLDAPVVACVPLKVVFGRIYEALNGWAQTVHK